MREGTSHRIVTFIANLSPLYIGERVGADWAARSLTDGTLILPVPADDGEDDDWVTVHWQGDESRSSTVRATYFATTALVRYVELHAVTSRQETKDEYAFYDHHFTVKTGASLMLEVPDQEAALARLVAQAAKLVGREALVALIKAKLGL